MRDRRVAQPATVRRCRYGGKKGRWSRWTLRHVLSLERRQICHLGSPRSERCRLRERQWNRALSLFARVRPRSRFGVYARAFDPDLCSSSELTEETGVAAEAITFPGSYYTNPGDAQIVSTFSSR